MNFFYFKIVLFFQLLFFSSTLSQIYTPIDYNFKNIIRSKINSAERIINGFIYKFNDDDIFNDLKKAKDRGVELNFICDKTAYDYTSKLTNVTIFDNIHPYDKLHAKSLLFDNKTLLIGSFNLDKSTFSTNFEIMLQTSEETYVNDFIEKFNELKKYLE